MKKIHVVSKTHLDLGFTDYAENIRRKYIDEYIPSAALLAEKVNTKDSKRFIWTTGSWIIKEALRDSDEAKKQKLIKALKDGNIVPHAMPFTTHSELFDEDTFDFGLTVVDEIDKIRGRKTVAAKMTDVPGHTKAVVPILAKHGIKLLHIGVNGASAVPEVPECFLWKCGESEIVVICSGDYGGAFKSEYTDDILYFDHTLDNKGAPSADKVIDKLEKIKREYPDYEVSASTLDDFAEIIWEVRDRLPVLENEIGDSWIHGSASDPYKSAALRELMRLKRQWLKDGSMVRMSEEYKGFSDALLCVGEHTCGMDSKTHFADYENYLKPDFQKARKNDRIKIRHPFKGFPKGLIYKLTPLGKKHSYGIIERSWEEQREYIDKALSCLSDGHRLQAKASLERLRPESSCDLSSYKKYCGAVKISGFEFSLNEFGGIGSLKYKGGEIIRDNNSPLLEYRSYTSKDYDFWFSHYARNMQQNEIWARPDFGRPLLKYYDGKYPDGRFYYKMSDARISEEETEIKIFVNLECDKSLSANLGAPKMIQIIYTLGSGGLAIDLSWFGKDAVRTTEAIFFHLYPAAGDFKLIKLGSEIDYKSVVSMGGRNLHAVEKCTMKNEAGNFRLLNIHSPLISIGRGKILEYDNKIESLEKDGISYVLYNNVWGTNFPLWYEDNARFEFRIELNEEA
ncbi:MAG: DUF5054 domain-containing protein [Acutalibacteraceae bacterium]|nr:DUF5054 domain-containing protein [Oscillospiraceae bacterium]